MGIRALLASASAFALLIAVPSARAEGGINYAVTSEQDARSLPALHLSSSPLQAKPLMATAAWDGDARGEGSTDALGSSLNARLLTGFILFSCSFANDKWLFLLCMPFRIDINQFKAQTKQLKINSHAAIREQNFIKVNNCRN